MTRHMLMLGTIFFLALAIGLTTPDGMSSGLRRNAAERETALSAGVHGMVGTSVHAAVAGF